MFLSHTKKCFINRWIQHLLLLYQGIRESIRIIPVYNLDVHCTTAAAVHASEAPIGPVCPHASGTIS